MKTFVNPKKKFALGILHGWEEDREETCLRERGYVFTG
jgi:hypothetical protein